MEKALRLGNRWRALEGADEVTAIDRLLGAVPAAGYGVPFGRAHSGFVRHGVCKIGMASHQELPMPNQDAQRPERDTADEDVPTNTQKDPDDWVTGDESMTGAQASYLETLSEEAGEPVEKNLTKAEASKRIEELRQRTGRGIDH
jgi:hypothetical protein